VLLLLLLLLLLHVLMPTPYHPNSPSYTQSEQDSEGVSTFHAVTVFIRLTKAVIFMVMIDGSVNFGVL
jgi:hypothetical protein